MNMQYTLECILGFSVKVIRNVTNEISEPFSHTFNLTFIGGYIPDDLKKALITPVFKTLVSNVGDHVIKYRCKKSKVFLAMKRSNGPSDHFIRTFIGG